MAEHRLAQTTSEVIGGLLAVTLLSSVLRNSNSSARVFQQVREMFEAEQRKLKEQMKLLDAHMAQCRRCKRNRKCKRRKAMAEAFLAEWPGARA